MSEFRIAPGFEDVWRPVALPARRPASVLSPGQGAESTRARLRRVVRRAPEVMVKVTGRTADAGHLRAHLDYISRNGGLVMEDSEGARLIGRAEIADLAEDWSAMTLLDPARRANTPFSLSIVLSMPEGAEPGLVLDAARAFAQAQLGGFDHVFVLHTDTPNPHVHLAVRTLAADGARLNPKKADLETWRQAFAQALRDRGVEAEATPRRTRGVTRKADRGPLRRIRDRQAMAGGSPARVLQSAMREAGFGAGPGKVRRPPWETRLLARQVRIRGLYLAQARLLQSAAAPEDRALGRQVEAFVRGLPAPETQRLALARALRARTQQGPEPPAPPVPGRDR